MKRYIFLLTSALICAVAIHATTVNVTPGAGTLRTAVRNAAAGDVLILTDGEYSESSVKPTVALTIQAAEGAKPVLKLSSRLEIKADFALKGVTIKSTTDVIRCVTADAHYNLTISDCLFCLGGETVNTARAIYAGDAPAQLQNISVTNCTFDGGVNGTGRFIYLYSSELAAVQGTCLIDHCTFYNSNDTRGVYPANVNGTHITNCIFMNTEERDNTVSLALYGSDSKIENCLCWNAPIKLGNGATQTACLSRDPWFVDAAGGNFQLSKNSAAVGVGTDGSNLGDPRWGVSDNDHDTSADPYEPYKMPYSMSPTTTSVKVLWQMAEDTEATEAVVFYGTSPDNLDRQITTDAGWNVEGEGYMHVVTLTDLQPATRYYFTVGASATRRCDKVSSTKTAPEQGTAFRIFTISDIHGNARNNWSNCQDFICGLNCDISLRLFPSVLPRSFRGFYQGPARRGVFPFHLRQCRCDYA